jgi:hypothetical protein
MIIRKGTGDRVSVIMCDCAVIFLVMRLPPGIYGVFTPGLTPGCRPALKVQQGFFSLAVLGCELRHRGMLYCLSYSPAHFALDIL